MVLGTRSGVCASEDPTLEAQTMSRRCGSSRTLGPVRQCAVYVRGGLRCAWCTVELTSTAEASIDHLDGNHRNDDPSNLATACRVCNRVRQDHWDPGHPWTPGTALTLGMWGFDAYLVRNGTSLLAAVLRIEEQRFQPLPLDAGRELAERWHAGRLQSERARKRRAWLERREERLAIQGAVGAGEASFP